MAKNAVSATRYPPQGRRGIGTGHRSNKYGFNHLDSALQRLAPGGRLVAIKVIKTGLIGLTRYLAAYWAQHGVRTNALSPGGIYAGQPQDFVTRISELIPMGRMAGRDEYRAAVQFLCSDASAYMTGQNIVMDGGRSIL